VAFTCSRCGLTHVSPYYFRAPDLCTACFERLGEDQRREVVSAYPRALWEAETESAERLPSPEEKARWEEAKVKGPVRFVLERAIPSGLLIAGVTSALTSLQTGESFILRLLKLSLPLVALQAVVFGMLLRALRNRVEGHRADRAHQQ
jgi:hypothetical protein